MQFFPPLSRPQPANLRFMTEPPPNQAIVLSDDILPPDARDPRSRHACRLPTSAGRAALAAFQSPAKECPQSPEIFDTSKFERFEPDLLHQRLSSTNLWTLLIWNDQKGMLAPT
jgi:hypothetical protein